MSAAAQILYLEDNASDYELFSGMLEQSSQGRLQCSGAPRLSDGLTRLRNDPYAAVLLDLNLLDCSGAQGVRILHDSHPRLPIVVLTGAEEETMQRDAFASGAQEYLVKGRHTPEQLRHSVMQSIRRKKMEGEFFYRSHFDALTRLPNLLLLEEHLHVALARAHRMKTRPGLMLIEIRNFDTLCDIFGVEQTQRMLVSFAESMKHVTRRSDVLARWDDRGFALLLEDAQNEAYAELLAQRIAMLLRQPITLSGGKSHVDIAIGLGIAGSRTTHSGELVIAAKGALNEAYDHYAGIYVFDPDAPSFVAP